MEQIKKIFSPDNRLGRTVRTYLQAFVGISGLVAVLVALPDLQNFLIGNNLVAIGSLAGAVAVATAIHNAAEKLLKYLFGEE